MNGGRVTFLGTGLEKPWFEALLGCERGGCDGMREVGKVWEG